jgi:hypothetical protein
MNGQGSVEERIKNICVNYFKLMIECAENETTRTDFQNNPHQYLNKIGMNVPDRARIHLDTKGSLWPVVYIKTEDEKIAIAENKLALEVIEEFPSEKDLIESIQKREHIHVKALSEVDVTIHEGLKQSNVVVKMPFLDAHDDILTDIKFSDDAEIVLTGAC